MMTRTQIASVTVLLVAFTAIVHILLGLRGVNNWLTTGDSLDVLARLFLLSGISILGGMVLVFRGFIPLRSAYFLGAMMMVIYLGGYADWHVFEYTQTIFGLEDASHDHSSHNGHNNGDHHDHEHDGRDHHDTSAVTVLTDHLRTDLLALACKVSEAASAVLLTALGIAQEKVPSE